MTEPNPLADALNLLEEAVELGEQREVVAAATELEAALGPSPRGPELQALVGDLVRAAAAETIDRGRCARLIQQARGQLATAPAPSPAPAPAPAAPPPAAAEPRWIVAADSQDVLRDFAVEARTLLDEAEQAFLALETAGGDGGIATAFRAFHTIKGVAGFLELDVLATTAHRTESLLAEVRDGALAVGPCIDVVLGGVDLVRALIDCALRGATHDLAVIDSYYRGLEAAGRERTEVPAGVAPTPAPAPAPAPAARRDDDGGTLSPTPTSIPSGPGPRRSCSATPASARCRISSGGSGRSRRAARSTSAAAPRCWRRWRARRSARRTCWSRASSSGSSVT